MDRKPAGAALRAWFYLTGFAVALAAWLPWFAFREPHQDTTFEIALLRDVTCSNFVVGAEPCRAHWLGGLELAWELVPIFLVTRVVTIVTLVALFAMLSDRVSRRTAARVALVAIVVFAVHVAAVPGDQRYRAVELSWGALFGLGAATSIFLHAILVDGAAATRDGRRIAVLGTLGALLVLAGSLWLPIVAQREAFFPQVPATQSAYSFGALAKRYHWHDLRFAREHYMEHTLGDPEHPIDRLFRKTPLRIGIAVAMSGLFVAVCALVTAGPRGTARSGRLVALGALALLSSTLAFAYDMATGPKRSTIPAPGAAAIALGLACVVWVARQRRAKP